jgi:hypothetical protein
VALPAKTALLNAYVLNKSVNICKILND